LDEGRADPRQAGVEAEGVATASTLQQRIMTRDDKLFELARVCDAAIIAVEPESRPWFDEKHRQGRQDDGG
jgi:hypothetical protein